MNVILKSISFQNMYIYIYKYEWWKYANAIETFFAIVKK